MPLFSGYSIIERAPTLKKLAQVVIQYYNKNKTRFEKVIPKEFKYSSAWDKAFKTDNYNEYNEIKKTGGTEIDQRIRKYHEENPDSKGNLMKCQFEIEWELMYISKIENGTLPPSKRTK